MQNLYAFLKLNENSSEESITASFNMFKEELLKFSPGMNVDNEELRSRSPEIWDAYQILLDPVKKKEHDDTLHEEHRRELQELKAKSEEYEAQRKSATKARVFGSISVLIAAVLYFVLSDTTAEVPENPKWKKHDIKDNISLLLPSAIDTSVNIIPPFLLHYIKKGTCYRSALKGGFSVTVAQFDMNDHYKISQKDISYIVNVEVSSHMTIIDPDSVNYTMNLHGYNMFVRKGTYSIEGILRAFENYSMVNGTSAIKVIISYIPGNELQAKYAEIIFRSLLV